MKKLISVFNVAGVVSRIDKFGGGNKVSKFTILTLLSKVNCRGTSSHLSSTGSVSTEQK
jgi:hypothetical protein